MSVAVNSSTSSAYQGGSRLVAPLAKAAGIFLALVSGIYAVLSYYSSIAALRQSVEANKLTLLIYCDSNNVTDRACDEVRHDLSTEQAVEEVFGEEKDGADEDDGDNSSTQTGDDNQQQQSSTTSLQSTNLLDDGYSIASSSSSGYGDGAVSAPEPTTFLTSTSPVMPVDGICSRGCGTTEPDRFTPTASPTAPMRPPGSGDQQPDLADYSSWHATCATLHRRSLAAKTKLVQICASDGPPPVPLSRTASFSTNPTSALSDSCSELEQQYLEARWAAKHYSCPTPNTDTFHGWRPSIISPAATAYPTATGVPAPGNNETKSEPDHIRAGGGTLWVFEYVCIVLLVGLCLGFGVRKIHFVRQQRRDKMLQGLDERGRRQELDGISSVQEHHRQTPELLSDTDMDEKYDRYYD